MNDENLLLTEVARRIGIKAYRINYALACGLVAEPMRIGNRRVFQSADVQRLTEHFNKNRKPYKSNNNQADDLSVKY